MQAASRDGEYSLHCCRVHFRFMVKLWFLTFTVRFYPLPEKKKMKRCTQQLEFMVGHHPVDRRDPANSNSVKTFPYMAWSPNMVELPLFPPKFERETPCSNISWCSRHFFMQERSFPAWIHSVSCHAPLSFSKMLPLLTDWPWLRIWFRFWSRSRTQVDRFRVMRTIREIWQTIQTAGLSTTCVVPPASKIPV